MADFHIKVGGAWKAIDAASVKVSGAWKDVQNIYCKVGGAWKKAWQNVVVNLSGTSGTPIEATQTGCTRAGWRWNTNGTVDKNINGSYSDWGSTQTPVEYTDPQPISTDLWLRFTYQSGTVADYITPTVTTWGKVCGSGASAAEFYADSAISPQLSTYKVDIATDSGGSNIVATGYYRGTCDPI